MEEEYFSKMGGELARRWDPENFDDVAHEVLREIPPPPDLSFTSLTDWALARDELPNQVNFHSGFGSPPIVVYADEECGFRAAPRSMDTDSAGPSVSSRVTRSSADTITREKSFARECAGDL